MTDMKKCDKQYLNDHTFHALVESLENLIENFRLTPEEVRRASFYASYRVEMRRPFTIPTTLDGFK